MSIDDVWESWNDTATGEKIEMKDVLSDNAKLKQEIASLRALLKESEWAASNREDCYCWCCHGQGREGKHAPDCRLAKALE